MRSHEFPVNIYFINTVFFGPTVQNIGDRLKILGEADFIDLYIETGYIVSGLSGQQIAHIKAPAVFLLVRIHSSSRLPLQ